MEQRKSPSEGQPSVASPAPPSWMHRARPYGPERRASMLEHMARARSLPQPQAATSPAAPQPSDQSGKDILSDFLGHTLVFGIVALLFQSPIPLYLGAFLFIDGERIERAFGKIGIRFDRDTIGPDIVKGFVSLFAWFALLASLRPSAPAWLATWIAPDASWSFIAGIALALAIIEAFAAGAMRRALPWLGLEISAESLTCSTIKLVVVVAVLACLVLLGSL
ncbi:hypothetical protein JQ570_13430 [Bradyrhizobium liaoningense]|nr:hypothetical protein [Bradyrhizobium liaoningense]